MVVCKPVQKVVVCKRTPIPPLPSPLPVCPVLQAQGGGRPHGNDQPSEGVQLVTGARTAGVWLDAVGPAAYSRARAHVAQSVPPHARRCSPTPGHAAAVCSAAVRTAWQCVQRYGCARRRCAQLGNVCSAAVRSAAVRTIWQCGVLL
eukprot:gene13959-biopygen23084